MKKLVLIMTVVALLTGMITFSAMAFGRGAGVAGTRQMGNSGNYLNLTFEQQQKFLAIRQDFQKDTQTLRFDFQKKNLELRQLWAANPLNQSAIDVKTKEVTALEVKLTTKAQEMQDKIKGVLTAEQLKQWNDTGFNCGPGMRGQSRRGGRMGGCF